MKTLILISVLIITLSAAVQTKINPILQKKYMPPEVEGLYIGANVLLVKKIKGVYKMKYESYKKTFETGNVKEIEYHIDNAEIQYFQIEYNPSYNLAKKM